MNQDSSNMPKATIIPAEQGAVLQAFGDTVQMKLGGKHTGNTLAIALGMTPPGAGRPPHLHRDEDEIFLIVEGRLSFLANGEWTEAGPGAVAYIPRGAVHTFRNIGDTPSRHWIITTPSGFENFFEKCAVVFAASPLDMPRIMEICGEHGIEFVDAPQNA